MPKVELVLQVRDKIRYVVDKSSKLCPLWLLGKSVIVDIEATDPASVGCYFSQ